MLRGKERANFHRSVGFKNGTTLGQLDGVLDILSPDDHVALNEIFDLNVRSIDYRLRFPRTTFPVPSNRSPRCLTWPFFSSEALHSIHFCRVCCISSGENERNVSPITLLRNKNMKSAIASSSS